MVGFARKHLLEIAEFELIEAADGRILCYDVNTNNNYDPDVERIATKSRPGEIARCLQRVEAETHALA